jgi:large subunit ribosomal protein L10
MEKKIDIEKIKFLATLPSMDELRGKILGLISAPAQKIASIVKEPSGQLARLVSAHGENMDKSN